MNSNKLVFFLIKKYLKFDKTQPFISISAILAFLGVSIGIMVLIIAMALMNGMSKEFEKRLFTMNYPLTIYPKYVDAINKNLVQTLEEKYTDMKFSPYIRTQAIIKRGNEMSGGVLFGVDFDKEKKINEIIANNVKDVGKYEVVIGNGIKEELYLDIGDKATFIFTEANPTGIALAPTMKRLTINSSFKSGLVAYDKAYMYTTIESINKILRKKDGLYDGIHIYSKEPFEDIKLLKESLPKNVGVIGWWQQNGNFFSAQELEKKALFIVLMLIILVASLNIISSLLMTVMNRRKEIALLLSLGASAKEIKKTFFYLGSIIGGSGIIVGTILGFLGMWILGSFDIISIPEDVYGTSKLPMDLLMSDFVAIIVGGFVIVLLSSFYPAHKASQIDIIKVLKYE
jgi:putative ABC transport system permease protein